MLQNIIQHPYFQLTVAVLAPLSILVSYLLYRRSLRLRLPRYAVSARTLVSSSKATIPDLTFAYRGQAQPRVSVARVGIWNDGRETIRRFDLIAGDPLRIEVPEGVEVLDVAIVEETTKGIAASFQIGTHDAKPIISVTFEFLDHRDGF